MIRPERGQTEWENSKQGKRVSMNKDRYPMLDSLRGLAISAMVLYHGVFDLIAFYGYRRGFLYNIFYSPLVDTVLHPLFAGLFLYISGVSCHLSRNNQRRGLRVIFLAGLFSLVTAISELFLSGSFILFGILHLMGFCILLYPIVSRWLERFPVIPTGMILILLWVSTLHLYQGRLADITIPPYTHGGFAGLIFFILGYPVTGFSSSDYFPIIPWAFIFFAGVVQGKHLLAKISTCRGIPIFSYIGQHTLGIYLLHQPILFIILSLILQRLPR